MIAVLLLAYICGAVLFLAWCGYELVRTWLEDREEWGGVYAHHDAMTALERELSA